VAPLAPSVLDGFRLTAREKALGLYGVHVWQEGAGEVTHFWRSDDPVCLYSGAKTFVSVAVGQALGEGRFGLDDRVADFFPDLRECLSPGTEAITVRNLLQMTSGKREFWFAGPDDRRRGADWAELFFSDPVRDVPGTKFFYSNACSYLLGRVIEAVSGQTLRDYLVPRLFDPLGIDNPQWHTCPGGHTLAATQLFLTLKDFAKLGRLLLQRGEWEGKALVSSGYLDQAYADTAPTGWGNREENALYGYHLWRSSVPGAFRADGKYGQYSIVVPSHQAVVTITAHEEFRTPEILQAVREDLLPRLSS
jgi:CubicO group peptidase (beta-lactamase class C family)